MADEEKKPDCVKVAVRMRPLSSKELGNNESAIVELEESNGDNPGSVTINDPEEKEKPAQFAFDIVFGTQCLQENVFEVVGKPALTATMAGYNGTIFAYGQTGSGKSWSMMGGPGELRGIIPRVNENIFVHIEESIQEVSTRRFLVTCSFFEIYNEIIFDLLNPCQDRSKLGAGLQVKEHPVLGIYVKDLQEIVVDTAEKLTKMMDNGTKNRAVSSTLMNSVSSRSHSIFTIKVHQKDEEDKSKNVFAKLNLVDLAGSERQKGTGASGQTLKEGANINKSLSALGNVINALVENANGKKIFVPFRNSKLTRVLQESLGGNSLCTMLAALSPAACNYEETVGTLRYANRAKAIKVSATKNEEASQISRLNAEIEELKKKLAAGGGGAADVGGGGLMAEEEKAGIRERYSSQLKELQAMVDSNWEEKSSLSKAHEAQLSKALEEQKRQVKAMQEESKKRFRLLQDQNDLELTVRSLADCLQSLPAKADGAASACKLRSGEAVLQWVKVVGSISKVASGLKQQHTTALVFHGAFSEDLRLWVEGEEARDRAMARTGVRRAAAKLEKLHRECGNLRSMEIEGLSKTKEFAAAVSQAREEWSSGGMSALLSELREEEGVEANAGGPQPEGEDPEKVVPPVYEVTVEDVGRLLQLIEQQASGRASEMSSLGALELSSAAELVLRGTTHLPEAEPQPADAATLRSLASGPATPGAALAALPPRDQRPLQEWTAQDVDDTIETTEAVLMQLIPLDGLNRKRTPQELLARPPPKFVHDVGLLMAQSTGFLGTLSEEWPEPREGKIDLLQHVADTTAQALGLKAVDFDPSDVLKGKEVPKTLRLLQLLAIAGARHKLAGNSAGAEVPKQEADGGRSAAEVLSVLEVIARCLQIIMEKQAARGGDQERGGAASPTRELENSYRDLQEKLEEETQTRQRQEQKLSQLQQQVQMERSLLQERTAQLEEQKKVAADAEGRVSALRRQVETLRQGILMRAEKAAANSEVARARAELESIADQSMSKGSTKERLQHEVKRLQRAQLEVAKTRETMEQEVIRSKQRQAEGLDGPAAGISEEIMLLQAEKQKLDVKVQSLEERMRTISQSDDAERQKENRLTEEKKVQASKNDDIQMQLQVVIEERDGLRDGMDMLWQEKTRADEELDSVSNGYTHLSDRLFEKIEERRELEEKLEQYNNLLKMLQENFEKSRHSPVGNGVVSGAPAPAQQADDENSSHYSDEEFEEPD